MSTNVGSAVGYLDLDISGFLTAMRTANSEAESFGTSLGRTMSSTMSGFGSSLQSAGQSLSSAGTKMTAGLTVPILGVGTAIAKVSSDFEAGMSKVEAISGSTEEQMDRLSEKAKEMGASTKFSATEAASAFQYMAMAGWDAEKMIDGIDGIMNLAAADGLDLATTSDIVTDALTGFGLQASDAAGFADILAVASSNANTNVSMLGESFKYVAPIAGTLGYSAEDTAVALGLMANSGIKASQAGTSLRSALTNMVKPTNQMANAMIELGLMTKNADGEFEKSFVNADGTMKSLDETIQQLKVAFGGLTEEQQASSAAAIFGKEAMSGMLAIINSSEEDYNKLKDAIYDSEGAASQMAETMNDNFAGQVVLLKSALEGVGIELGEVLMPYLKDFVENLSNAVEWFSNLSDEQKRQVVEISAMVAAAGPLLLIVGKLTSGLGVMISTLAKLPAMASGVSKGFSSIALGLTNMKEGAALANAGFAGLAGQAGTMSGLGASLTATFGSLGGAAAAISAIAIAVVALIAGFIDLWKTNESFRNELISMWNEVKKSFDNFTKGIVERINEFGFEFENITEVLKAIWKGFTEYLAPIFIYVFDILSTALTTALEVIMGIVDVFIGVFTGDWERAWDGIKAIFSSVWEGIGSLFESMLTMLKDLVSVFLEDIGTSWETFWRDLPDMLEEAWTKMIEFIMSIPERLSEFQELVFQKAVEIGQGFRDKLIPFFESLPELIGEWLGVVIGNLILWSIELIEAGKQAGADFIFWITEQIRTLPDKFSEFMSTALQKVKDWGVGLWTEGKAAISELLNGIDDEATTIPEKLMAIGDAIVRNLWEGILSAKDWFFEQIGDFFSSVTKSISSTVGAGIGGLGLDTEDTNDASRAASSMSDDYYSSEGSKNKNTVVVTSDDDSGGGDTYNFYSPEAITPTSAARELEKAKQELALG